MARTDREPGAAARSADVAQGWPVDMDVPAMGRAAGRLVLRAVAGGTVSGQHRVPPTPVVRASAPAAGR